MQRYIDNEKRIIYKPDNPHEDIYQALHDDGPVDEYYEKWKKSNKTFPKINYFISCIIAKPLFYIWGRFFLGVKVYGKKNISELSSGGITISNHVQYVDFSLAKYFVATKNRLYTITLSENFRIPFVKYFIAKYGCIPLAETMENKKHFIKRITQALTVEKAVVHIFPEAALWPYYTELRPFNDGASHFSVKTNKPIVPFLITFRKVSGLRRLIRRRPLLNIHILQPQYPNKDLPIKERCLELNQRVHKLMQDKLDKEKSYSYYSYLNKDEYIKQEQSK